MDRACSAGAALRPLFHGPDRAEPRGPVALGRARPQRSRAPVDRRHLRLPRRRFADHLGDRIGRRRLLLIGATVFGLASALAAFASTPALLIATRALMGDAAATLAPSTLSLIRNMFHDPHERTVAISVWIMSYSAGAAIGPVI